MSLTRIGLLKKEAFEIENKDNPDKLFKATSKTANIQIDAPHDIFKIVGAKRLVHEKKKSKLGGATLAVFTGGLSLIASGVMNAAKSMQIKRTSLTT